MDKTVLYIRVTTASNPRLIMDCIAGMSAWLVTMNAGSVLYSQSVTLRPAGTA
jgi:hypothetical protein